MRRTILFQRTIAYAYEYLNEAFIIYGDVSAELPATEFETFDKAKNYSGFLIRKKDTIYE